MNCLLNNVRQEWKHLLMSFMKRTQGLDLTACRQNQNAREIRQTKSFSCLLISINGYSSLFGFQTCFKITFSNDGINIRQK